MQKSVICIECPMGCNVSLEVEGDAVLSSSGYGCKRGKIYAEQEVIRPMRILTTTLLTSDGRMIAVKTSGPIDKTDLLAVMDEIRACRPSTPIALGEVLIPSIRDGVDLIAADRLD